MKNYKAQIKHKKEDVTTALLYGVSNFNLSTDEYDLLDKDDNVVNYKDSHVLLSDYVYYKYYLINGKVHVEARINFMYKKTEHIGGYRVSTANLSWGYGKVNPPYTTKNFYMFNRFYRTCSGHLNPGIVELDSELIETGDAASVNLYIEMMI